MKYNTTNGKMQASALDAIAKMDNVFITPDQAAPVLGASPMSIRMMARDDKLRDKLGFPVICVGNRTKIPRIPFLQYVGWRDNTTEVQR